MSRFFSNRRLQLGLGLLFFLAAIYAEIVRERGLFLAALGLLYLLIWRRQYAAIGRYRRILREGERLPLALLGRPEKRPQLWARGRIPAEGEEEIIVLGLWGGLPPWAEKLFDRERSARVERIIAGEGAESPPATVRYLPRYMGYAAREGPGSLKRYARRMSLINLCAAVPLIIWIWLAMWL